MKHFQLLFGLLLFNVLVLNAQYWKLAGNSATTPGTHFIGTTDTKPLIFKVNNQKSGILDYNSSTALTSFGYRSLYLNTTGFFNSGFGHSALAANTTGRHNTGIGVNALRANVNGSGNTATGSGSLASNISGLNNTGHGNSTLFRNTTGNSNTAIGNFSLYSNRAGHSNIAIGPYALFNSIDAINTVAIGDSALFNQIEGYDRDSDNPIALINTAVGSKSLYTNTSGRRNTAIGDQTLFSNTSGYFNTGIGSEALRSNTFGHHNTALGVNSLRANTGSSWNTAIGYNAGSTGWGYYCTYVGYNANQTGAGFTNSMALGNGARITADNYIAVGNTAIKSIKGQVSFTTFSDGRYKKDIKEDVPGLVFINKLKPVTYHLNVTGISTFLKEDDLDKNEIASQQAMMQKERKEKEKILYTGFIAQDVESAAKELNYEFSGVDKPENETSLYGLRYSEFVVPLVKAVQELNQKSEEENAKLKVELAELRKMVLDLKNGTSTVTLTEAKLEQNTPNPAFGNTSIRYHVPTTASSARLSITNAKGQVIKEISISNKGTGHVNYNTSSLAAGTYNYTLYVDGKQIATKWLIIAR